MNDLLTTNSMRDLGFSKMVATRLIPRSRVGLVWKKVRGAPIQLVGLLALIVLQMGASSQFDFTESGGAARWQARHNVAPLKLEPDGLRILITGDDPFIEGPPLRKAVGPGAVCLRVRMRSEAGGTAQVFWAVGNWTEGQSVSFAVEAGAWTDLTIPLPILEKGTRLRFDPPGTTGICHLAWLIAEDAAANGISHVEATADELKFTVKGLAGDLEVVELAPYQSLAEAISGPIVHTGKLSTSVVFSIPRFEPVGAVRRDRVYSAFVPVQTHKKFGRIPVGAARHVDSFAGISKSEAPFPVSTSKKGLQIQMADDALKLGVQHAALNLDLNRMVDLSMNAANYEWTMDGEKYFFDRGYVDSLGVKKLTDAGCVVTLILLSYGSGDAARDAIMQHPRRIAKPPNNLAAFNTVTPDGLRHYKACLEFLADHFSQPDGEYGRAANYIVGNEVSAHWEWYNLGLATPEYAIGEYERSVRIANTAVRKFSSSSRVYLSLEHHWTLTFGNDPQKAVAGRTFIEEFNRLAQMGGNYDWNLAYHPYPENLFEPRTWNDKTATASPNSQRITFKNLEQLTLFFRRPELLIDGHPRHIILSEQGFNSDGTPEGDTAQAAAYCYAWVKVSRLDGIDSFILHRHVDHSGEGGLNLGLWRRQPDSVATPSTTRPMYEVFSKADTPDWEAAFKFALPVIGIKNWDEIFRKR
ncbi:MAG: hypothetical protein JSS49_14630 [Planctomycetes bacterium]|nr:hypothetical protein [Planctomycetota bacterium]